MASLQHLLLAAKNSRYAQSSSIAISNLRNLSPATKLSLGSGITDALTGGINAWSVNGATLASPDFASNLFAASLFPYLVFLYFLSRSETKTPTLGNFGFQFLLAFVFATIPAGIYAKYEYNDILANIDFLHGGAESLLTITNLLIIIGFRQVREKQATSGPFSNDVLIAIVSGLITFVYGNFVGAHPEPANALSLPTWVVHTSTIFEWLLAMKLIWEHSDLSQNPRWKGMTWAMAPSHTSGLCACTYHLFYNSPSLLWIVSLQAAMTLLSNTALAFAAYRIYQFEKESATQVNSSAEESKLTPVPENSQFFFDLAFKSIIAASIVKFGALYFDFPFEHSSYVAAGFIFLPTLFTLSKWFSRSNAGDNLEQVESLI